MLLHLILRADWLIYAGNDYVLFVSPVPEELKAERSRNSSPSELNKGTMITTLLMVIFLVGST